MLKGPRYGELTMRKNALCNDATVWSVSGEQKIWKWWAWKNQYFLYIVMSFINLDNMMSKNNGTFF